MVAGDGVGVEPERDDEETGSWGWLDHKAAEGVAVWADPYRGEGGREGAARMDTAEPGRDGLGATAPGKR